MTQHYNGYDEFTNYFSGSIKKMFYILSEKDMENVNCTMPNEHHWTNFPNGKYDSEVYISDCSSGNKSPWETATCNDTSSGDLANWHKQDKVCFEN